ncbi:MAG: primosomal protein N' [Deltaproteobacteria bacterium]|nr:primosomal protein N' [Deltaproteobacteria bacterium]
MSGGPIWEVAVPVPLRRVFSYEIPASLGKPEPGARVLVPFGRRRMTGVLLGPSRALPAELAVKPAIALLDDAPALPEDLLGLLREAAAYYMHPLGEVLRAALPAGTDVVERGKRLAKPRISGRLERIVLPTAEAASALEALVRRAPARAAVLQRVVDLGEVPMSELRAVRADASGQVRRLEADGLVAILERDRPPDPFLTTIVARDVPPVLTAEQAVAVAAISARLERGGYEGFLLHGVTGSGKTEVYLRAVDKARELGRGALVLVPEIALTPQLVERYRARFGDALAVLHSGLTERERFEQWRLLRSGRVHVAVGVRSAVFAPVERLGIVVVDEEHDGSFKQERGFAYNARDLALLRAARAPAVAVLGSATPSLESHRNAGLGKLTRLVLAARATAQPLPEVDIVDLTRHRFGPGGQNVVSGPLYAAIEETLQRGEQVILFLNRRGFAPGLLCTACGEVRKCSFCAVSLTLHRRPPGLVCHYCGAREPIPERCGACASPDIEPVGTGTQRAETVLADLFPNARIARLDRDVASGRSAEAVLDRLRRREIDILVGTQMVTKGHDFPLVTLVGVLLADVGLHMPDFRAAERSFQLLTQVAGRAGRALRSGKAIIQTYSPTHPAVLLARTHDFLSFAAAEAAEREELGYPPFGRLALVRVSGPDAGRAEAAARDIAASLRASWQRLGRPPVSVLGPAQAPLAFVQGRHRFRVLVRSPSHDLLGKVLEPALPFFESPPAGVHVRLDMDPMSML